MKLIYLLLLEALSFFPGNLHGKLQQNNVNQHGVRFKIHITFLHNSVHLHVAKPLYSGHHIVCTQTSSMQRLKNKTELQEVIINYRGSLDSVCPLHVKLPTYLERYVYMYTLNFKRPSSDYTYCNYRPTILFLLFC